MRDRDVDKLYRKVNRLFAESLTGGVYSHRPWNALSGLRRMGIRLVFDKARSWSSSRWPMKRARAAAILSQLRQPLNPRPSFGSIPAPAFQDQSFEIVLKMIEHEQDLHALEAHIFAFGHLDNLAAVPHIKRYVDHASEDVRYAMAFTLGSLHAHPESTAALAKLADDSDRDVRSWAIFGLGVLGDADSEELRKLFLTHLNDSFLDARIEAAASLAKRKDPRVARPLIGLIRKDGPLSGLLEAARELLEIDEDTPDWYASEYIGAFEAKFDMRAGG